ncbi:MAG TPA: hypothetical protein ENJ32_07150 [Crenotrichaceae bacterium]|nr:hypothetical protein [Crenotrichaceae bacterium]
MKIVLISLCVFMNGCSVYSAMKAPDPVDYNRLVIGAPRDSVVTTLGSPVYTTIKQDITTDHFEFKDGYSAGYKSRALVYLAGDFFSGGLAEIIFWPMEEMLLQGSENKAVVEYDHADKIQKVLVFSDDQKLLYQLP